MFYNSGNYFICFWFWLNGINVANWTKLLLISVESPYMVDDFKLFLIYPFLVLARLRTQEQILQLHMHCGLCRASLHFVMPGFPSRWSCVGVHLLPWFLWYQNLRLWKTLLCFGELHHSDGETQNVFHLNKWTEVQEEILDSLKKLLKW